MAYIHVFAFQKSKNEYLVLWKGYPMEDTTWELPENIEAGLIRLAFYNTVAVPYIILSITVNLMILIPQST